MRNHGGGAYGAQDGMLRRVLSSLSSRRELRAAAMAVRDAGMFDSEGYRRRYADVQEAGAEPLEHYLLHGWKEKREPGGAFRAEFYLRVNPDVAALGVNPLLHFCTQGWKEGRLPMPGFDIASYAKVRSTGALSMQDAMRFAPAAQPMVEGSSDLVAIAGSGLFDAAYYLERYPEAGASGATPLEYYLATGVSAGHDPAPWFSTRYYLKRYPDVVERGVNPFHHYCSTGWKELRNPSERLDAAWFFLSNLDRFGRNGGAFLEALRLGPDGGPGVRAAENYSVNDRVHLLALANSFLSMDDADPEFIPAVAELCVRLGGIEHAAIAFRRQIRGDDSNFALRHRLIELLSSKGAWQSVAEEAEILVERRGDDLVALKSLGDARAKLRDTAGACDAYERYLAVAFSEPVAYELGVLLENAGRDREAQGWYQAIVANSRSAAVKAYGVGALHQAKRNYALAVAAYQRELGVRPLDPELLFRLGHSSEQAYLWSDAMLAYRRAIALRVGRPEPQWHYRCGVVAERLEDWETAAAAYMMAVSASQTPDEDLQYRLGYSLERLGLHRDACRAYLGLREDQAEILPRWQRMPGGESADALTGSAGLLVRYFTRLEAAMATADPLPSRIMPGVHAAEANRHLMAGRLEEASRAYLQAADRFSGHPAEFYRAAGVALGEAGQYEQACRALRLQRVSGTAGDVAATERDRTEANRQLAAYVEYSRNLPLDPALVMYESFSGLSMSCNPLAIYREILADPAFRGFRHAWVVDDPARVPDELKSRDDLIVVKRESDAYLRCLATAGYLINNSGFSPYFIRREGQKYLATWHGTPLKTLGKEQKYKFYDHKRTQRNLLQATHVISPNAHTTSVLLDSYEIRQIYGGKFAETGYPRVDSTLMLDETTRTKLRARMSLSADRPVVLYAPTWRGTPDEVHFDFSKLESDLRMMSALDCQIIFRGHSWLERAVNVKDIDFTVVPSDIDTNDLLSVVDLLVTDYSSVFFDFIATGKPIAYYVYDLEKYEAERGMYFDMKEMPGPKCRTIEELCACIPVLLEGGGGEDLKAAQEDAARRFNNHDDGRATRRVIDFFFKDDASSQIDYRRSQRPSILLYGGTFDGGPDTERILALAAAIDTDVFDVAIAFTPTTIEAVPGGIARFRMLPPDIIGIPRYGTVPMTQEERDLRRQHEAGKQIAGEAGRRMLRKVYDRELRRMIAGWVPDHIVVVQGQDRFWPSLLLDNTLRCRKLVLSQAGRYYGLDDNVIAVATSDSAAEDAATLLRHISFA